MALFSKKFCDLCGEKIGLLGNRKLSDGNMCKDCAKGISPHLAGRRQLSVADMQAHLAYREENRQKLERFSPTRTIGSYGKLYLDDNNGWWLVSRLARYKDDNPDMLTFDQVTGCTVTVDEDRDEIKRKLPDGKKESYNPPRYQYAYDFKVEINVASPWFSEIALKVNNQPIQGRGSTEYRNAERQAQEIRDALTQLHTQVRQAAAQAAAPRASVKCSFCGAVATPDASGKCPFCESTIGV
ncbi:MAG: DUF4428 domain-containing protein [Eubacteriales bacterium]|nr:DUF4428 domain-containing protein [Eubacteriales bacterium]